MDVSLISMERRSDLEELGRVLRFWGVVLEEGTCSFNFHFDIS